MTIQELFEKWTGMLHRNIRYALKIYYMEPKNSNAGDERLTRDCIIETFRQIRHLEPVLSDMAEPRTEGIEEIFEAVYGEESDEAYALNKFLSIYDKLYHEKTENGFHPAWDGCADDRRLKWIITEGERG